MLISKTQQNFVKQPSPGTSARNKRLYGHPRKDEGLALKGLQVSHDLAYSVAEALSLMLLFLGKKKKSIITTCLTE